MTSKPLNEWTATDAAAAIAARRISSQDLVRACLDRIAAREPEVGAWIWLDRDQALAAAKARDSEAPRGPLHGVPVGIKDIIDTADMPTGYGSRIYEGNRPKIDAACVALIKRSGGIVLGKTVSTEFAYFSPGKTKSPHNPRHTPGGSSSGSAAAVADFMVPLALGSQTAASVTRPASFCGLHGFKPSHSTLSLAGIKALSPSFDTLGTFARSVDDTNLLWSVLHGVRPEPLASPARKPRIGLCRTPQWSLAEPSAVKALDTAAGALAKAGATIDELKLPGSFEGLVDAHKLLMAFEAARAFAHEYDNQRTGFSPQITQLIEDGLAVPLAKYLAARQEMEAAQREIARLLTDYDVVLAPAARGEAPEGLGATGDPVFSRMWTLLQIPTITLPVIRGTSNLPVGVQLLGAFGDDARLLQVARWAAQQL